MLGNHRNVMNTRYSQIMLLSHQWIIHAEFEFYCTFVISHTL